jgi:hypothetical protein
MARESGTRALEDAGLGYDAVQQAYAGYVYGESTSGQRAVYELAMTGIPVVNRQQQLLDGVDRAVPGRGGDPRRARGLRAGAGLRKDETGLAGLDLRRRSTTSRRGCREISGVTRCRATPEPSVSFDEVAHHVRARVGVTRSVPADVDLR